VMTAPRTLTRGQARLLAFTAGAPCANLYYAQPLLPMIAASLHISRTSASLLVTMFIGGALGSWAGAHAYERWGWAGASVAAAAFPALGLLCWLAAGRRERRFS
jgi:predicted MFS family arabinose efflux permease